MKHRNLNLKSTSDVILEHVWPCLFFSEVFIHFFHVHFKTSHFFPKQVTLHTFNWVSQLAATLHNLKKHAPHLRGTKCPKDTPKQTYPRLAVQSSAIATENTTWAPPKKLFGRKLGPHISAKSTLPETNIAHEHPNLSWEIPSKWRICHGYVSFREGRNIVIWPVNIHL